MSKVKEVVKSEVVAPTTHRHINYGNLNNSLEQLKKDLPRTFAEKAKEKRDDDAIKQR